MAQTDSAEATVKRAQAMAELPGAKKTRPTTYVEPDFAGGFRRTFIIQTVRAKDEGFAVALQVVNQDGTINLVLPSPVCEIINRQRKSLMDRSTPASRAAKAAKAERAKQKRDREARRTKRTKAA